MSKWFLIFVLLFSCLSSFAQTSLFTETLINQKIQGSIDSIYNFNYDNADEIKKELDKQYPNHPFGDLYYSMMLYWKYFPITTNSSYHNLYVGTLNNAILNLESAIKKEPNNDELIFFDLMARLLLLQFYASNNLPSKLIPLLAPSYKLVKKGFVLKESINDFYFSTGIYNYYREYYPKAYPVYKPVAFFFPKGDARLGLQQLNWTVENGTYLKTEALFFLVYIHMNFQKDFGQTLKYVNQLEKEFPDNLLFVSYKIRTLLLLEEYSKANSLISILRKQRHQNDFFKIMADLFEALIVEKQEKNYKKAEIMYRDVIKEMNKYGSYGNFHKAIAYFGLSRIFSEKDKAKSKVYRKKALELSAYDHINFD